VDTKPARDIIIRKCLVRRTRRKPVADRFAWEGSRYGQNSGSASGPGLTLLELVIRI